MEHIDDCSSHLYGEHPSKKRGYCVFCVKKSNIKPSKQQELGQNSSYLTFKLNKENNSQLIEKKEPKRKQFQESYIKWWCQDCTKFICNEYWSLYY